MFSSGIQPDRLLPLYSIGQHWIHVSMRAPMELSRFLKKDMELEGKGWGGLRGARAEEWG